MDGRNVSLASRLSSRTVSLPVNQPERDGISVSSPDIDRVDPSDTSCRRRDRASLRGRRKPPHDGVRKSERCNLYRALISTRRPHAGRYAQSSEPRPRGTSFARGRNRAILVAYYAVAAQGSRIRDQRLSVMQGPSTAKLHRLRGKRLFPNQGAWLSGGLRYQCGLMCEPWVAAGASSRHQRNSLPSAHMRCRITASLRATATVARRRPRRLAIAVPQAFSADHRVTRVSRLCAATNSASRASRSPLLLIAPLRSISPEAYLRGVNPRCAPTSRDLANRAGSSIAVAKVNAVTAPTPGTVSNRRHTACVFTALSTITCRASNCSRSAWRAASIGFTIACSRGRSAVSSSTRASNAAVDTGPTLRPKALRVPRISFSSLTRLVCNVLRLVSSSRSSWLSAVFT